MRIITAMVQPFMLNRVTIALEALENFPGMTATDARNFGRRRSLHEQPSLHVNELKAKTRIEIVAPDEQSQLIIETLMRAAHTGNSGDGKVFVWSNRRLGFRRARKITGLFEVRIDK
jgi:nitrogen regulatory protein P-II 1